MTDPQLPEFDRPPVVETVLSARFRGVEGFGLAQIVQFWEQSLASELPTVEERPPYDAPFERFGEEGEPAPFTLELGTGFPTPRLWFSGGNDLVQLQPDWFAYNWRQTSPTDEYTRYRNSREKFEGWLRRLVEYLEALGGRFVPVQCEVTYVNHVPLEEEDLAVGPLGEVLRDVRPTKGEFLAPPETAQFAASYVIETDDHRAGGRLHVRAERAWAANDKRPVVLLNITARGTPRGQGIEGVLSFCDLGHVWVVAGFKDMVSQTMLNRWGFQEESE